MQTQSPTAPFRRLARSTAALGWSAILACASCVGTATAAETGSADDVLASIPEIVTDRDREEERRKKKIMWVGAAAAVVVAIVVFHFLVMDLDVFWARLTRKFMI